MRNSNTVLFKFRRENYSKIGCKESRRVLPLQEACRLFEIAIIETLVKNCTVYLPPQIMINKKLIAKTKKYNLDGSCPVFKEFKCEICYLKCTLIITH